MTPEIETLWKLQELDERRVSVAAALAKYPQQRSEMEHRVTTERARLESAKAKTAELQKKRRERERDIEVATAEERKFQSQLPAVKKNEEYTALLHEIAGVKARRSTIETDVLMILEDEDRVMKERPAVEQALKEAERDRAERLAALAQAEASETAVLSEIDRNRVALIEQLSAGVRSRYERIQASREGRAVVPILKGACGGCYRAQPPQTLVEAKRGDRMLLCDGCGRIVLWPPGV